MLIDNSVFASKDKGIIERADMIFAVYNVEDANIGAVSGALVQQIVCSTLPWGNFFLVSYRVNLEDDIVNVLSKQSGLSSHDMLKEAGDDQKI